MLHPDASVVGLGVGGVPVITAVKVTRGATKTNCVADAVGEARGKGEATVAVGVFVRVGVAVAGGAIAVCVWKTDAANVPTPAVRIAFTSCVASGGF